MMDRVSWFHKLPYEGPEKLVKMFLKVAMPLCGSASDGAAGP